MHLLRPKIFKFTCDYIGKTRTELTIKMPLNIKIRVNRRSSSIFCDRLFKLRQVENKLPESSERETAWFRVRPYKSLSRLFSQFTISSGFAHIPDKKQRTYKTWPRHSKKYLSLPCT